jgi:short-subunit dehydrogenase involved in D-alanine esterification of teichoic acids
MSLELNLTGKTAIITGGSAGIGLVIYARYD